MATHIGTTGMIEQPARTGWSPSTGAYTIRVWRGPRHDAPLLGAQLRGGNYEYEIINEPGGLATVTARVASDGLKAIRGKASSFANDIKSQFAGAFAAGSIINFGKSVLDFAGNIQDLSDRLGVSITKLQEWNFAAMQTGSSKEAVANFFELLNDNRAMALAGNQAMIASFRGLGVTINDLNTKPVDEIAEIIANTVKSGNVQELISQLRDVGGRVAGELVPAMKAGIRDMADEAHRLGVIFEEKVIGRLDALGDRLTTLQMKLARLAGTSGPLTYLLDSVESTINRASVLIAAFQGLVKGGISGAQDEVLKELTAISAPLQPLKRESSNLSKRQVETPVQLRNFRQVQSGMGTAAGFLSRLNLWQY